MTYRLAFVLAFGMSAAVDAAFAQIIAVKTAPIADDGQFAFLPSSNLGMGGLSIAAPDSALDPFTNPAKGSRLRGTRIFGAPTFFSVSRKAGGGLTLPLGAAASSGAWFTQVVIAMQDVDRVDRTNGFAVPVFAASSPSGGATVSDVVTDQGDDASRQNRYVHGLVGRRFGTGLSVAASASWWRLNALDGAELFYPSSQSMRQRGEASDIRIGVLDEIAPGHSLELVAVRNRFAMNQDVSVMQGFWDPTQRQFAFRPRVTPNANQSDTWALQLGYMRPLADSTWRIGAIATTNRIDQPRLPGYELPDVAADASRSYAYNFGAGVVRSRGVWTVGVDGIYEPIWSRSWVTADDQTALTDGTLLGAGVRAVDNRFRFHNGIARVGFSAAVPLSKDQSFTFETGGQLHAIRYRLEQRDVTRALNLASTQHWNEWTRSWGVTYRFAGATLQYRGNLTTGAQRNGFDDIGNVIFDPIALDVVPGFGSPVPFGLSFGKVRTTSHQIAFVVPIR